MDKQQVIAFIQSQLSAGKISSGDLMSLAQGGEMTSSASVSNVATSGKAINEKSSRDLTHVFYAIGAIIAVVGVGVLIAQNWTEIGFIGRIASTLGISLAAYVAALLLKKDEQRVISQVLFTVSAALAPLGSYVLIHEARIDFSTGQQVITALILAVIFAVALFVSKKSILVLIVTGFLSWAYMALVVDWSDFRDLDLVKYAIMFLGVAYVLVGFGSKSIIPSANSLSDQKEKKSVRDVLLTFGTIGILGAAISIGGMFDLIVIALIFATFYASVYVRSRAMLAIGALFLIGHIIKLTGEYFVDSIGWSVALIVIGFLVIAIGYLTYYLNKRFITVK
jgi:uncharacterized membrane protein